MFEIRELRGEYTSSEQEAYKRGQQDMLCRVMHYKLPCEVRLPPSTTFGKGVELRTLLSGFQLQGRPKFDDWQTGTAPGHTTLRVKTMSGYTTIARLVGNPCFWIDIDGNVIEHVTGWKNL